MTTEGSLQIKKRESADKPGFVEDNHSSGSHVTMHLKQPTREQRGPRIMFPYLVLLRVGFTMPQAVTRCAVRSYRTISPLPYLPWGQTFSPDPIQHKAVYFLLHFP